MNKPHSEKNKGYANQKPEKIDSSYVFDPSSGIYTPQTYYREHKRDKVAKFLKKWTPIVIGAATIILLTATVIFTKKQWKQMRREADAANNTFLQVQHQTTLMRQQLIGSQAAVLSVQISGWNIQAGKITIAVAHEGIINGTLIDLSAGIVKTTISSGKIIGKPATLNIRNEIIRSDGLVRDVFFYESPPKEVPLKDWPGNEVVVADGTLIYDDGFGNKVSRRFCFFNLAPFEVTHPSGYHSGSGRGTWNGGMRDCDIPSVIRSVTFQRDHPTD